MIPPGTIGLVSTRGFAAACIRLGTRSHENHVIIADGHGGCYEAQPGGVQHNNTVSYTDLVWLDHLPMTGAQRIDVTAWCASMVGVPYNWPAIAVFAITTFADWLPHGWLDKWANDRRNVICSELAVQALRYAGIDVFAGSLAATIPPAAFVTLALKGAWS